MNTRKNSEKSRFYALVIAVSWFTLACQNAFADPEPDKALVVLFGDSITSGYKWPTVIDPNFQGNGTLIYGCPTIYVGHILRKEPSRGVSEFCSTDAFSSPIRDANEEVRDAVVVNWGVQGQNTEQGANRISANLNDAKSKYPATKRVVLINFGTNDPGYGLSSSTTGFNNRLMMQRAKAAGFTPAVTTLLPRSDRSNGTLNSQIQAAASAENVTLVDMSAEFVNYPGGYTELIPVEDLPFGSIRLHPHDKGQLFIAELWFDRFLRNAIVPLPNKVVVTPIIELLLDDDPPPP